LVNFGDGTQVTSAAEVAATSAGPGYCNVTLLVPDRINIVVQLPTATWNGKFQALGNGGYAGSAALGIAGGTAAIAAGYAAAATDTGHQGEFFTGEWAWSPTGMNYNQIQDFAYRRDPRRCAGDQLDQVRPGGVLAAAGHDDTGNRPAPCKLQTCTDAVTSACEGSDGVMDGLFDSRFCRFDPASLIGKQTPCGTITAADAEVIEKSGRDHVARTAPSCGKGWPTR